MGRIQDINIKNRTYYFYDEMVNIKDFDPNLLQLDKKSFKKISITLFILHWIYHKKI